MLQPEFIIGSSKRSCPLHYSRKLPVPQVTKRAGRDTAVHSNVYRRQKPCKHLRIRIPQKSIYDLSGKTIVPFTVNGGSRFAGTIQTIQQLQPGAAVWEDGLSISRSSVLDAPAAVTEWVGGLEL